MLISIGHSILLKQQQEKELEQSLASLSIDDLEPTPFQFKETTPFEKLKLICKERIHFYETVNDYLLDKAIPMDQKFELCKTLGVGKLMYSIAKDHMHQHKQPLDSVFSFLKEKLDTLHYKTFLRMLEENEISLVPDELAFVLYNLLDIHMSHYIETVQFAFEVTQASKDAFDETSYLKEMHALLKPLQGTLRTLYYRNGEPVRLRSEPTTVGNKTAQFSPIEFCFHQKYAQRLFSRIKDQLVELNHKKHLVTDDIAKKIQAEYTSYLKAISPHMVHPGKRPDIFAQNDFMLGSHFDFVKLHRIDVLANISYKALLIDIQALEAEKQRRKKKNQKKRQKKKEKEKAKKLEARRLREELEPSVTASQAKDVPNETRRLVPTTISIHEPVETSTLSLRALLEHKEGKENKSRAPIQEASRTFTPYSSLSQPASELTFIEKIHKKLSHRRTLDTYFEIFEVPTPHEKMSRKTLEKIIKLFGGDIVSPGKTSGSSRRIVLPTVDETSAVWATLPDGESLVPQMQTAGGIHWPHSAKAKSWMVRAVGDALTRAGFHPTKLIPEEAVKRKLRYT